MIITCPSCQKKFNVDQNKIPKDGRFLKCGSCGHKWFYKIEKEKNLERDLILEKDNNNENIPTINNNKKVTLSRNRSLTVKTINYKKFFKLLIVACISIIALVLLIDTFKSSIKFFIPNIDFYLNNLYQSLIDIKLFITDLLK